GEWEKRRAGEGRFSDSPVLRFAASPLPCGAIHSSVIFPSREGIVKSRRSLEKFVRMKSATPAAQVGSPTKMQRLKRTEKKRTIQAGKVWKSGAGVFFSEIGPPVSEKGLSEIRDSGPEASAIFSLFSLIIESFKEATLHR